MPLPVSRWMERGRHGLRGLRPLRGRVLSRAHYRLLLRIANERFRGFRLQEASAARGACDGRLLLAKSA